MRSRKPTLTEHELEIMKIVWDLEHATVRDVYEAILKNRRIAYTTVMTMMKILETKGYLKKSQEERAYVYHRYQPKQSVIAHMVNEFVDRVFNGSAEPLLVHLVAEEGLTEKELAEIGRLARKEK